MKIYYSKPSITKTEIRHVMKAAKYGWGDKCYDYINLFERKFQSFINTRYSIATSSCTGALHLSLLALGIKDGDEVIIPEINWVAVSSSIECVRAKPVIVDIEKDSWCIDPISLKKNITSKTKAVIAVHLYGNLCNINQIKKICKENKIKLIEDAAEALGSKIKKKYAGTFGDIGVFSFHGAKTMTTGEGGMIVTRNRKLYEKIKALNNHGRTGKEKMQFLTSFIGLKYKISNIQAALGYAQLLRLKKILKAKRKIFYNYKKLFSGYDISMNIEKKTTTNSYWMPTVIFNKKDLNINRRNSLIKFLKNKDIDIRVFFWPLSIMSYYKSQKLRNKISYDLFYRGINLPSYVDLKLNEQKKIVSHIINFLKLKKNVQ